MSQQPRNSKSIRQDLEEIKQQEESLSASTKKKFDKLDERKGKLFAELELADTFGMTDEEKDVHYGKLDLKSLKIEQKVLIKSLERSKKLRERCSKAVKDPEGEEAQQLRPRWSDPRLFELAKERQDLDIRDITLNLEHIHKAIKELTKKVGDVPIDEKDIPHSDEESQSDEEPRPEKKHHKKRDKDSDPEKPARRKSKHKK